jgi:hypothetical protein
LWQGSKQGTRRRPIQRKGSVMHVLQYIAVVADSKDEAFRTVKDGLESELGNDQFATNSWFDWFVAGGGRWNPNPDSQYQDDQTMIISYEESPDEYREMVDKMITHRMEEFNSYRKSHEERNVDINTKLDSYKGIMTYDFELYYLKKMIDMIQGEWDMNSFFYDMNFASTNLEHMYKNIDLGNKNWYLVPVDFHF